MKKTANGFFIVIFSLTIFLNFGKAKAFSAYGDLLYSEDFDNGFDNFWEPRHFTGTNTNLYWKILDDKYGIKIIENGQTGNSVSGNEAWTDYAYELDMYPILGTDRNFVFRYQKNNVSSTLDKFYEVHVTANGLMLGKAYGHAINASAIYVLDNNKEYRWRIELVGANIKVFAKEKSANTFIKLIDYTDNNDPYLSGSIGVRGSAGANFPTEVYFDNIYVYDLTGPINTPTPPPPTPTMTPVPTPTFTPTPPPPTPTPTITVPYYSQRDDIWKSDRYDFLNRTIEQVGCALTSAAMVLRHHGIDKLPLNGTLVDLTPGTLNRWLNLPENTDGWWRHGSVSWGAITRLAKHLHDQYSPVYPKLEYEIIASGSATLTDPLILKYSEPQSPSSYHFVVGYGVEPTVSGLKYSIHDPWDATHTLLEDPPTILSRIGHFYPTDSDLGFLFLNADEALSLNLTNSSGETLGLIQKELPLANRLDPFDQTGQPFWNLSLKYPGSGIYHLTLFAPQTGWYRFEIYAYNRDGQVEVIKRLVYMTGNQPTVYRLTYNGSNTLPVAQLTKMVSYRSLRELILAVHQAGWLDTKTKDQFLGHLSVSEKVYSKDPPSGLEVLNTLKTHFNNTFRQGKLREPGFSLLIAEINLLLTVLD